MFFTRTDLNEILNEFGRPSGNPRSIYKLFKAHNIVEKFEPVIRPHQIARITYWDLNGAIDIVNYFTDVPKKKIRAYLKEHYE